MTVKQTTSQQDRNFIEQFVREINLDTLFILDWVTDNFDPEDVFENDQLEDWALDNGFVRETQTEEQNV